MKLIKAFKKYQSHHFAILPYNLNWMMRDTRPFANFLKENPLVVADIGARGGSLTELDSLKRYINCYAFEADREECERIKNNPPGGFNSFEVFAYIVGETSGEVDFNIYQDEGLSSLLIPAPRYEKVFGTDAFAIKKITKVESITLDAFMQKHKKAFADIIKLDTQGTELNILMSSRECVSNAFLIEAEVEFVEEYKGQYLFHDICEFMYDNGFEMLYLNRAFANRNNYDGNSRGQLIFGDALFGRREDRLENFDHKRIAKYIIALINYGHIDFAFHLYRLYPDAAGLLMGIELYFKTNRYDRISRLKRRLIFEFDKFICLLLHLRKTNSLPIDSDRNWPVR